MLVLVLGGSWEDVDALEQRLRLAFVLGILGLEAALLDGLVGVLFVLGLGCQQHVVSPAPPDELAQLLEHQQVQDAACGDLVIIVPWYPVPVQTLQCLRERDDEGDGKRVRVSEHAHGGDEVGGPSVEAETFRDDPRDNVRDQCLDDEDDGDDAEFEELVGVQLGGELGED